MKSAGNGIPGDGCRSNTTEYPFGESEIEEGKGRDGNEGRVSRRAGSRMRGM